MAQNLDATYPAIARWVMEYGWIEIGHDDMSQSFIRALDAGGLVWAGQEDESVKIPGARRTRLQRFQDEKNLQPI